MVVEVAGSYSSYASLEVSRYQGAVDRSSQLVSRAAASDVFGVSVELSFSIEAQFVIKSQGSQQENSFFGELGEGFFNQNLHLLLDDIFAGLNEVLGAVQEGFFDSVETGAIVQAGNTFVGNVFDILSENVSSSQLSDSQIDSLYAAETDFVSTYSSVIGSGLSLEQTDLISYVESSIAKTVQQFLNQNGGDLTAKQQEQFESAEEEVFAFVESVLFDVDSENLERAKEQLSQLLEGFDQNIRSLV